jgi:hypothetical protein
MALAATNRGGTLPGQHGFAVAGTSGRIEAQTSTDGVAPAGGTLPGRPADSVAEKSAIGAPPHEGAAPDRRWSVAWPAAIALLIAVALLFARRLF